AKQFLELGDRPVLALTLEKFQACPVIDGIVLVVPSEDVEFCEREIIHKYGLNKVKRLIPGGERRQDSVRSGIEATGGEYGLVMIHDGVRPFIKVSLIEKVVSAARTDRAVITALPAKETVKEVGEDEYVIRSLDRRRIWMVQTPQAFRYEDIMEAHQKAGEEGWEEATDDAVLVERMGVPVRVVHGSEYNIKITTPHDLEILRCLYERNGETRDGEQEFCL
ncbi:MAG TPA: 2-C-methyl-D-erythritol 4-phosphate cytidylyltransferase, partial [Desulfobacteraceae bacterium]|nr:2-C-methyl-D-erythritol 4-phosphate cytidylyltransferase [Desulfobacteraceae bacterium]